MRAATEQEAQLPLRNRASAMHFFVAKLVIFYRRNDLLLRLSTPDKFVTHTENKLQHATTARAHDARPNCRLMFLFFLENPTEYPHKLVLPETRLSAEDLHREQYAFIFISFHAIIFRSRTVSASQTDAKTEIYAK